MTALSYKGERYHILSDDSELEIYDSKKTLLTNSEAKKLGFENLQQMKFLFSALVTQKKSLVFSVVNHLA